MDDKGNSMNKSVNVLIIILTLASVPFMSIFGTYIFKVFNINASVTYTQSFFFLGIIAFLRCIYTYITVPVDAHTYLKYQEAKEENEKLKIENQRLVAKVKGCLIQEDLAINNEILLKSIIRYYMEVTNFKGGVGLPLKTLNFMQSNREKFLVAYYVDEQHQKEVLYLKESANTCK